MSDFSLDTLADGREGVQVYRVELIRSTPRLLSDEEIAQLEEARVTSRAWGLPTEGGSTLVYARFRHVPERDEWHVGWGRVADWPELPPVAHESSAALGGREGLEQQLRSWFLSHGAESNTVLFVDYVLQDARSPLLPRRKRPINGDGGPMATQVGSFYQFEGTSVLRAATLNRSVDSPRDLVVTAIGGWSSQGWPDVVKMESELWQEVKQLVGERRQ